MYSRTIYRIKDKGFKILLKLSLGIGLFRQPRIYQDSNGVIHEFRRWSFVTPLFEITWWNNKAEYET